MINAGGEQIHYDETKDKRGGSFIKGPGSVNYMAGDDR